MLVSFGPFAFDRQRRLLRRGDTELPLPPACRCLDCWDPIRLHRSETESAHSVWRNRSLPTRRLPKPSFSPEGSRDYPAAPDHIPDRAPPGLPLCRPVTEPPSPRPPFGAGTSR